MVQDLPAPGTQDDSHAEAHDVSGFFVLANKSLGLYANPALPPESQADCLVSEQVGRTCRLDILPSSGGGGSVGAAVEVWDIAWLSGRWQPPCRVVQAKF